MARPKKITTDSNVDAPNINDSNVVINLPPVQEFDVMDTDDEPVSAETIDQITSPTDPRWTDYVLGQLEADEKQDDNPKADGLRRLVEKLIGPIISTEIDCKCVPTDGNAASNNSATVIAKVVVMNRHLGNKPSVTMSSGDASSLSCPHPYNKFLTPIAETRAKVRCYKEILRLKNVVSADEIQGVSQDHPNQISDNQVNLIDSICKRLNLSVKHAVLTAMGDKNVKPIIGKYTKLEGADIIDKLTKFSNSGKPKSDDAPDYDAGWREYFA